LSLRVASPATGGLSQRDGLENFTSVVTCGTGKESA
jgi:hypothetical protein